MMRKKLNENIIKAQIKLVKLNEDVVSILKKNDGIGELISSTMIGIISIVIGLLLLGGLYVLFSDTILPALEQRIKETFEFKG